MYRATMLIDSFDVEYSHSQQKRKVEGDVYTYFCDFLQVLAENENSKYITLSEIIYCF